ncbi:solute:Na+ symporter, SSS family [Halogranum amylolyticum]|uniref:Solute:Na+ symporter, SSS family n=1 Tax=Halogranum amylolyticum TaxID=660520 RepID=A0A1H8V7A0_9EURY|nr:sodium:solute symporter [Halogranum amylolyticum]SEP11134.1 solute:Na+ symporter, SSS family [Halogranum amylolyticum]
MAAATIDVAVVALYLLGMVGLGYWGYRKSETLSDYLVAGRNIPIWMYVPVMSAVILGGASTVGGGGLGYQHGVSGAWLVIMLGLGTAALGLLISTNLANLKAYSLGEVLERRYDRYSGTIGALIAAVYALTIAITQTIAIGKVFSVLFGYSQTSMIVAAGVIIVLYTALGGMLTVTITDFVQWCIMTVGIFLLALPLGLSSVGGISGLTSTLDAAYFDPTGIGVDTIASYFLLYVLGIMIGQDIWQRVFTAENAETARTGTIIAGAYAVVYGIATALLGTIAVVLLPNLADPELALPRLILQIVPTGLSGLILAGFLSAMMSTADSTLLASSTLVTSDIYKRFINPGADDTTYTRVSRIVVVLLGGFMVFAAIRIGNVVNALVLAYDLLTGAIFVPVFGAFFWKRATWQGALSSICLGGVVVVVSLWAYGFSSNLPIIYGLVASTAIYVGVSLATGPPAIEKLSEWRNSLASSASN